MNARQKPEDLARLERLDNRENHESIEQDSLKLLKTNSGQIDTQSSAPTEKNTCPPAPRALPGVVVGRLLALSNAGVTPWVRFEGQTGAAALRARSCVLLTPNHIGQNVTLAFEQGRETLPIITGVLVPQLESLEQGQVDNEFQTQSKNDPESKPQESSKSTQEEPGAAVLVDVDGSSMLVTARDRLVLRCGQASLTLTSDGHVRIVGKNVVSRSKGVNRLSGGMVQFN